MNATMKRRLRLPWTAGAALVAAASMTVLLATAHRTSADQTAQEGLIFSDPSGVQRTVATGGAMDLNNPFFQDLGTNGRTCFTCHRPGPGLDDYARRTSRSVRAVREGLDPVFRTNDGSDCEGADVSSLGRRRSAFSMLLSKGVIRVGLKVPDRAEFEIVDVDDPYGCGAPLTEASMYRRPLPSTNVAFLSTVMWDGRETVPGQAIAGDLTTQAIGRHDGARSRRRTVAGSTQSDRRFRARSSLRRRHTISGAGSLSAQEARGGARILSDATVLHRGERSAEHPAGHARRMRHLVWRLEPERLYAVRRLGEEPLACAGIDCARRGDLQLARVRHRRCRRSERRKRGSRVRTSRGRNLHDLPRHSERRQSLGCHASEHWTQPTPHDARRICRSTRSKTK